MGKIRDSLEYWLGAACILLVVFIVVFAFWCLNPPSAYEAAHAGVYDQR